MAVLVVGVGYLGAALAASLLRDGERVYGLDNGFSSDPAAIRQLARYGDFHFILGSVTSTRAVARALAAREIDTVYLLAAQASGHPQAAPPRYTEQTNLSGLRVVLDAALRRQIPRLVYASSFRVYGPVLPPRVHEGLPYGRLNDLAHLSHVYGEKLLEMYASRAPCAAVAVRLAVVYGLGQSMKTDYRFMTAPNKFCLQVVRGEPIEITPNAPPTAFIHVEDACDALREAAHLPPGFETANAAGEVATLPAVATEVARAARALGLEVQVKGPATEPATAAITVTSRLSESGWRPTRTLSGSVHSLLEHFRAREAA